MPYFECCKWKHFDPTDTNMYFNSLFLQNIIEIKRSLQKKFSEDMLFNVKIVVEISTDLSKILQRVHNIYD